MKEMKKQLRELLRIEAPSGEEKKVVSYLKPKLKKLVDSCWEDSYGNLLGEKKFGTEGGPTIILSAHMDTVSNIVKGRRIIEKNGVFRSSKGVLGADDRAGIAIIMSVLRNIKETGFEGTIKVAFSREEEIGCIGSSHIDVDWYKGSDLAIVVDRRGNRDIVVGSGTAFCSDQVGHFFEECSAMQDMDWAACEGGISDACTFSENGVHSVNLSAGYYNEHTEDEIVYFEFMQDTVRLILQALALVKQFAPTFGAIPDYNKWVYGYSHRYMGLDLRVFSGRDSFGKSKVTLADGLVYITQGGGKDATTIVLEEETFSQICDSFYGIMMKEEEFGGVGYF